MQNCLVQSHITLCYIDIDFLSLSLLFQVAWLRVWVIQFPILHKIYIPVYPNWYQIPQTYLIITFHFLSLNYSTGFVFHFFHQNSDTQTILTIQNHVITKNHRISILHSEHKTWQLKIKDIRESDRGFYMVRWYDCCLNSLMFLHSFFV